MTKKSLTDAGDKKPPTISSKGETTSDWMVGNNNAEKRTKENASEFMNKAIEILKEDKGIYSLAGLSVELDTYDDVFEYIVGKYPCFSFIKKKINKIIESRVHEGAITGKIKETTSIFTLKNNHGWKDKTETDVTVNGGKPNLDRMKEAL